MYQEKMMIIKSFVIIIILWCQALVPHFLVKIPAPTKIPISTALEASAFKKGFHNTNMSGCQTNEIRDLFKTPKVAQDLAKEGQRENISTK